MQGGDGRTQGDLQLVWFAKRRITADGLLGIGEKYYPVPWSMLNYNEDKGGYVVPLDKARIENAPAYDLKDLTKHDGGLGSVREKTYDYYNLPT